MGSRSVSQLRDSPSDFFFFAEIDAEINAEIAFVDVHVLEL